MKTYTPPPVFDPGLLQNYIIDTTAEDSANVTTWNIYDDSSAIPVDGLGGTTSITLTQNLINPISSTGDFKLTKGAFNLQGEGISSPVFTIQRIHSAKIQQIEFNAKLDSGTYEKGDIRIYIIQDPNGTPKIIEPINVELELGVAGIVIKHIASFQTDASELNYSLAVHIASTSALAYTINFNNFKIWEPSRNIGAIITEWQSYLPTIQGGGTLTSNNSRWRRVGDSLEISGSVILGTTTNTEFQLSLPSGLIISDKIGIGNITLAGEVSTDDITASQFKSFILLATSGNSYLQLGFLGDFTQNNNALQSITSNNITSDIKISFFASVPIQGWGSSMILSTETGDGRELTAKYTTTVAGTSDTSTPIQWSNLEYDTHSAVTIGSNWRFIAPISGYYNFRFVTRSSSGTANMYIYVNGIPTTEIGSVASINVTYNFTGQVKLKANDYFDIRAASPITVVANSEYYIAIDKISSSSQTIARNETIECSYTDNSGLNLTNPSQSYVVLFSNRKYDSHSMYSNGNFIFPEAGTYLITANVRFQSTLADTYRAFGLNTDKGQSISGLLLTPKEYNSGAFYHDNNHISTQMKVVKGEILTLEVSHTSAGTVNITEARVEICRIG